MKLYIFGTLLTTVLTIAAGVVQGTLSNRWGASDSLRQAGDKLVTFPEKFKSWEMTKADGLEKEAIDQLQPAGYFHRIYVNRNTGAAVSVTVLLGQSGPISVHTPEICFGSRNHQQVGERQKIAISDKDGDNTIWKTTFRLSSVDAPMQNIYYGWSTGEHWIAAENPRFSYATKPFLYKIQLASQVPASKFKHNDPTNDPGFQFLTDCLPVLHSYLQHPASK